MGEPSSFAEVKARTDWWVSAGTWLVVALMSTLGAAMLYFAATAELMDTALLGVGGLTMIGFALSGRWRWTQQRPEPIVASLAPIGSPWLVFPLGALLLARFLLLPAETAMAITGLAGGIVFLLPVLVLLLFVALNVGVP